MDKQLFTIGEISKMKGITLKALRFYDKIGLLAPYYVDPVNQYRYYHISQLMHLDIIKAARNLEISPNALIPFFKNQDTNGILVLLESHKEKTDDKIRKLQDVITGIEHIRNNLTVAKESIAMKQVYTKKIPDRHIITMPYHEHEDPLETLNDFSKLDILVNQLGGIATYESGVLYKIVENTAKPDLFFTSVAKPVESIYYRCLQEGTYTCINFTAQNAVLNQKKLNKYIAKHQLNPQDIVQVELLTGLFESEQLVWELQVRTVII
ncbi:MAG: MerR family DNA-binding transcriptional regulator [Mobilitalea sp.]